MNSFLLYNNIMRRGITVLLLVTLVTIKCIALIPLTIAVVVNIPSSTRQQKQGHIHRQIHYMLFLNMTAPPH